MKVRIFNEGQPAYQTTVTDAETGEQVANVTDVDLHISVHDPFPYALLTVATPVVDVIADADIKRVCPCCGRAWTPTPQSAIEIAQEWEARDELRQ